MRSVVGRKALWRKFGYVLTELIAIALADIAIVCIANVLTLSLRAQCEGTLTPSRLKEFFPFLKNCARNDIMKMPPPPPPPHRLAYGIFPFNRNCTSRRCGTALH